MAIIHYPGYITKEEGAKLYKIKVRTLRGWIRDKSASDSRFSYLVIDGWLCIKDYNDNTPPPPPVNLRELELAEKFAHRNNMRAWRVFEEIIKGNVTGVLLAGRVFVIKTEPSIRNFVAGFKVGKTSPGKVIGSFLEAASEHHRRMRGLS